ncbi:hypothetical protein IMZ08_16990 [Bacillus luteolus]|uniref:ATP-dependent Lon protease n=1 Tax=Litchfieldia luteola TaxID=682179 RepID=A0ABR9QMJ8_9BACI|nr:hypothetical protein [Cytobacillus luteolus]MBE4909731.1 hypothetical protein [Cytobacillus luteolus]MBP1944527.1 hypothetical protein [Cytobacillus luteolus]
MYLLLSMVLSALLGFVLFMMGPLVGGIIAFGIVVGCIFRGLYLLTEIHKKLSTISPSKTRVDKAYEDYLEKRNTQS